MCACVRVCVCACVCVCAVYSHNMLCSTNGTADLRGEGATWQRVYDWEPLDYCQAHGNVTRQALILGGEAPMW